MKSEMLWRSTYFGQPPFLKAWQSLKPICLLEIISRKFTSIQITELVLNIVRQLSRFPKLFYFSWHSKQQEGLDIFLYALFSKKFLFFVSHGPIFNLVLVIIRTSELILFYNKFKNEESYDSMIPGLEHLWNMSNTGKLETKCPRLTTLPSYSHSQHAFSLYNNLSIFVIRTDVFSWCVQLACF